MLYDVELEDYTGDHHVTVQVEAATPSRALAKASDEQNEKDSSVLWIVSRVRESVTKV